MRRRGFIVVLAGAAAWPRAALAQQPERMRRVGVLMAYSENDPITQAGVTAFAQALGRFGWVGAVSGLKMTATRVTPGATSLSNCSHFPMIGAS